MRIVSFLLACLAASCSAARDDAEPILVFRFECDPGTPGAVEYAPEGEMPGWYGPPEVFDFAYFGPCTGIRDEPAIAFEIRADQAARFADLTERNAGKRLAILVDGRVLSTPMINERLPGQGLLTGGAAGFTTAERDALVKRLHERVSD